MDEFKYLNLLTSDELYIGQQLFVPGCSYVSSDSLLNVCQHLSETVTVRSHNFEVDCRLVDTEGIDKHPLLAGGMLAAVDVLGYVGPGMEVCFRNNGGMVFLDHSSWPPTPHSLSTYSNAEGLTCTQVDRVGTVVLVTELSEAESLLRLSSCQVTTRQILRLRDAVAGTTILGLVPYNVTLRAIARTPNWFNVNFLGTDGWISASYVETDGICE